MGDNPLRGAWDPSSGPRFPPMDDCYDRDLAVLAEVTALDLKIPVRRGVYVGLAGPNLETAAEYRMVRCLGGDVVGMSTVPEVIVARQVGLRVVGFSVVTNTFQDRPPVGGEPGTSLEDVIAVAGQAGVKLTALIQEFARRMSV